MYELIYISLSYFIVIYTIRFLYDVKDIINIFKFYLYRSKIEIFYCKNDAEIMCFEYYGIIKANKKMYSIFISFLSEYNKPNIPYSIEIRDHGDNLIRVQDDLWYDIYYFSKKNNIIFNFLFRRFLRKINITKIEKTDKYFDDIIYELINICCKYNIRNKKISTILKNI